MYLEKVKNLSKKNFKLIFSYNLISQMFILFRTVLLSKYIAGYYDLDGYYLAILGATYVAELIGEGFLEVTVPVFHKIREERGREGSHYFLNNLVNLFAIISLILIAIGFIFAPSIIKLFGGSSLDNMADVVTMFRLALPMLIIIMIRPIYLGYLRSSHGYRSGVVGGAYMNIIYVIYLYFFARFGLKGLIITGIFANAAHFLIIPKMMGLEGYKYKMVLNLKDEQVKEGLKDLLPMLGFMVAYIIILRAELKLLAFSQNTFGTAILANIDFVFKYLSVLVVNSFIMMSYSFLSETFSTRDKENHIYILNRTIEILLKVILPVTIVVLVFTDAVGSLFFTAGPGNILVKVLDKEVFAGSIAALKFSGIAYLLVSLNLLLLREFYSIRQYVEPIIIGLLTLGINYLCNRIFVEVRGLGPIYSRIISSGFMFVAFIYFINRKERLVDIKKMLKNGLVSILATIPVIIVLYLCLHIFGEINISFIIGSIVSFFIYSISYSDVKAKLK